MILIFLAFCCVNANHINLDEIPKIPRAKYNLPQPSKIWSYPQNEENNNIRLEAIKEAFLHSWKAYKKYAWGHDEVKPISGTSNDWLGGVL